MTLTPRQIYLKNNGYKVAIDEANSGEYADGRHVVDSLCNEYVPLRDSLKKTSIYEELDELCKKAREKKEKKKRGD